MLKVLVVDDQPAVCVALTTLFGLHGIASLVASSPAEALAAVEAEDIGVVLQDLNFARGATSGDEGLGLLRDVKALDPELPVLVMTAFASIAAAVRLIQEGANDYITKPWDDERLVASVKNLMQLRALRQENTRLVSRKRRAREEVASAFDLAGIVYASDAMHEVVSLAVRVAKADVSVLITGPNGSGKERLAAILRANSRRSEAPFVKVDAGALPDDLLEAELFGAEPGAFTGATKLRVGRFEEADGGTLFLDEIGNLSPAGQRKLLRVLQSGEFQRLGSSATRRADVRVVSATNADLRQAIARGTFREDLYFRLNVIELPVPALRDRPEDIEPLAVRFLADRATEGGVAFELGPDAMQALQEHDWPGNVRELENRIVRATLVAQARHLTAADLGLPVAPAADSNRPAQDGSERAELERVLSQERFVIARAAARLGLSRQALYRRMDRLGIANPRKLG